ncbi:hypothetical protein PSTT_12147 [Puccinia striiformis]|nr:hypothetical protein PSTT_12147 [Puccinia striiformis]
MQRLKNQKVRLQLYTDFPEFPMRLANPATILDIVHVLSASHTMDIQLMQLHHASPRSVTRYMEDIDGFITVDGLPGRGYGRGEREGQLRHERPLSPTQSPKKPVFCMRVTKPILNTSDLSWDWFGTPELSVILTELNASDWSKGLWHELDPNGTDMVRLLVNYKLDWDQMLVENEKVWILKAQLLDTPNIHPMAAKYSLSRNHPTKIHLPCPIYRMRSCASARQFMALFCQAVSSAPRAASDLKNLLQALCIVDAFPVYLNPDTSKQNQQETWQADPIGENPLEELRDKPTQEYLMEESIAGSWGKMLHPTNTNHNIDDRSPAIMQLLSAFQHWIYMYTNGQMSIISIQGVVPLLSKPKIVDFNPE